MSTSVKFQSALLCFVLTACAQPLDTQRPTQSRSSTAGQAIYEELCNRVAFAADPHDVSGARALATCRDGAAPAASLGARLQALHAQRSRLITALDAALSGGVAKGSKGLIGNLTPLYDVGTVRRAVAGQTQALASFIGSPDAVDALGQISARQGYAPADLTWGLLLRALDYPELDALADAVLPIFSPQGAGRNDWHALLRVAKAQLEHDSEALVGQASGELAVLRDFLLSPIAGASDAGADSTPVVARDARGIAQLATRDDLLPAPFVDSDGDGLPDVDAAGNYTDASGNRIDAPTPFAVSGIVDDATRDAQGRALGADGAPLYVYHDLAASVLAHASAQLQALVTRDPAQSVAWAQVLQAALGPQTQNEHRFGDDEALAFTGYDANQTPLLDVVQALAALVDKDVMPQALELMTGLLRDHEDAIAQLVNLGWQVRDWANGPEGEGAALTANNVFMDDIIEVLTEVARVPGLLNDVARAMNDPNGATSGAHFAAQMRYGDYIELNPDDVNGPPIGKIQTPVDRTKPDSLDNRSIFQRILHLVHDAYGYEMCNPAVDLGNHFYERCEMFQIDDAAIFYVQAIVGKAQMHMRLTQQDAEDFQAQANEEQCEFMENMTGIKGFSFVSFTPGDNPEAMAEFVYSVTPQASTRLLFAPYDPNVSDPKTVTRLAIARYILGDREVDDGKLFAEYHHGTLFAWELNGFFDAARPLLKVFADYNREDLIVKLVNTLHTHYASPACDTATSNPDRQDYSHQSNLRSLELLMARGLDEGDALNVFGRLNEAASQVSIGHGALAMPGDKVVSNLGRYLLLPELNPGMSFYSKDKQAQKGDGSAIISRLSPALVLKSALGSIVDRLDADLAADSAAHRLPLTAAQTFFTVEPEGDGLRLQNRAAKDLSLAFLDFMHGRLQHHREADTLHTLRRELPEDVRDFLAHPLTTGGLDVLAKLANEPAATFAMGNFASHLLGPARADTWVGLSTLMAGLTDAPHAVPILRAAAPLFDIDSGLLETSLSFLNEARPLDTEHVMPRLLQGLARHDAQLGEAPLQVLTDVFTQVNRAVPGQQGPLESHDFAALLPLLHDFLNDEKTGLARLLTITEKRTVQPTGSL